MHTETAPPPRVPEATFRPRQVLAWTAAALVAGMATAFGFAPALMVMGPLIGGMVLALLGSTMPFLWLIVATSGLGFGWLESEALVVAGNTININGLRWGLVVVACGVVLLRDGVPQIPRYFAGYIGFLVLATIGIAWTPSFFEGLKHVLQYSAPVLVALIAIPAIRTRGDEEVLRRSFWIGFAIAAIVGVGLGLVGLGPGLPIDEGRPIHRSTGPYLVAPMALGLAAWRFRGGVYAVFPAIVFVLGLLTLSRATVLVMLLMLVLTTWGKPLRWYVGAAAGVALLAALALQFEPFRERVFPESESPTGSGPVIQIQAEGTERAQLVVAGTSTSGRGLIWVRTLAHAVEAPVVGHGTGSSVPYLNQEVAVGLSHPHNEYLRVFHDHGVVGLIVFAVAGWMILGHLVRRYGGALDDYAREAVLAAGLGFAGYLAIIFFDNVLIYPAVLPQNLFLLLMLADAATRRPT